MNHVSPPELETPQALQRLLPWLVFLGTLSVYVVTLCPTIVGGDAGEMVTVAATGGVAHPPGYPLFTILGKLFSLLPWRSVAWRVNLLSATCGAGAAALLFLAVSRWTRAPWAGLLSAGLFAFSPVVWRYSVTAEVFALNDLILAAMLFLAARHAQARDVKGLVAFACVAGLGVSNHHTSILLALPLGGWMLWSARSALREGTPGDVVRRVLAILGGGLAGLLPYGWLPIAAASNPRVTWGEPDSLSGFLVHVLRQEYGTFRLASSAPAGGNLLDGLERYVAFAAGELTPVALLLAVAGFWVYSRKERLAGLTLATAAALVGYLLVFESLANLPLSDPLNLRIHERFWQHPNLLAAAGAGLGFAALASRVGRIGWKGLLAIGLVASTGLAAARFPSSDQSHNRIAELFGRSYLESLPQESLLVIQGDLSGNTLRYFQVCEGVRPDVRIVDRALLSTLWYPRSVRMNHPDLVLPSLVYGVGIPHAFDLRALFAANFDRFPIFVSPLPPDEPDVSWRERYELWPFGYAYRVVERGAPVDVDALVAAQERAMGGLPFGPEEAHPPGSWERITVGVYWASRGLFGLELLRRAVASTGEDRRHLFTLAAADFARTAREAPNPPFILFKWMGKAYQELGMRAEQKEALARYLRSAPATDPDYEAIRRFVEAH
jgi:hypothetical protein